VFRTVPDACKAAVRITSRNKLGRASKTYRGYYKIYRRLYPALKNEFQSLSSLTN